MSLHWRFELLQEYRPRIVSRPCRLASVVNWKKRLGYQDS